MSRLRHIDSRTSLSGLAVTFLFALFFLGSMCSCATLQSWWQDSKTDQEDIHRTAKILAGKGIDEFSMGNYFKARKLFNEILNFYPFSTEAALAQLKAGDSNYYMGNYEEALMLYHEFEERHPTNEAIPYVMYQIAMSYYQQIDRIDRDTSGADNAIKEFSKLLRAFPNSPYTKEAQGRIRAANEFLVNHEYFVVEFYLRMEKYDQAVTRLTYLTNTYPDAGITPRALELLDRLKAGDLPGFNLSSWFRDTLLPDWTIFNSQAEEEISEPLQ